MTVDQPPSAPDDRPAGTVSSLADLVDLVENWPGEPALYVRWTQDVERDVRTGMSRDELTGIELPGLSANGLAVEAWWGDRPLRAWLARPLFDYRHLLEQRGPGTRPWVVAGTETGRGPDNEPLIHPHSVVARVEMGVLGEVEAEVAGLGDDWGTLSRSPAGA
jgi:hypothetical protein